MTKVILFELPALSHSRMASLRAAIIGHVAKATGVLASTVELQLPGKTQVNAVPSRTIFCLIDTKVFDRDIFTGFFVAIAQILGWKDPLLAQKKQLTEAVAQTISRDMPEYHIQVYVNTQHSSGSTHIKPNNKK